MINRDGSGERLVTKDGWEPHWSPSEPHLVYFNRNRPQFLTAPLSTMRMTLLYGELGGREEEAKGEE